MQAYCTIPDCSAPIQARTWCAAHYRRWLRHGDPLALKRHSTKATPKDVVSVFWQRVRKTPTCWNWEAALSEGYGIFYNGSHRIRAHRFSYELLIGPIPTGLQLDHLCRNARCVNPAHLEAVTSRENTMRGLNSAADKARQAHCIHGHPFDLRNTYYRPDGGRVCRSCRNTWSRKHPKTRGPV